MELTKEEVFSIRDEFQADKEKLQQEFNNFCGKYKDSIVGFTIIKFDWSCWTLNEVLFDVDKLFKK